MFYEITPVPKPRMTQRDKWAKRPCVLRYHAFKDECKLKGLKYEVGQSITFVMPMPQSWSKKKKADMCGAPHTQKPDIDNLLKALFDAVYSEDSHIHEVGRIKKRWDYDGAIRIYD